MRLSKRERILVIGSLIIAVALLFLFYYYFPLQDEIKSLRRETEDITSQIDEKKVLKTITDGMKAEIEKLKSGTNDDESDVKREYLMENFDEPDLLAYINHILIDHSTLENIEVSDAVDKEAYLSKDFNINISTDYKGLLEIIKGFENGEKFSLINSLEVSKEEDSADMIDTVDRRNDSNRKEALSVTMTLRFYSKNDKWDGTADYNFMDGKYEKSNIFE